MTQPLFENKDSEDIEDVLIYIEDTFDIKFDDDELNEIDTFGKFCGHVSSKIQYNNSNDCTLQQAFYKLRNALKDATNNNIEITPSTLLSHIIPTKNRSKIIKRIEKSLGFMPNIIKYPQVYINTLFILLLISIIAIFTLPIVGLSGIITAIAGFGLGNYFKVLSFNTVGELAQNMANEHYIKSRRNPNTINKNEIEKVIINLFSDKLGIDKLRITYESKL